MTTFSWSRRTEPLTTSTRGRGAGHGFACPKCKERTHVSDSRQTADGSVRRRRVCTSPTCGHRFPTVEGEGLVTLAGAHRVMDRIKAHIQAIQELAEVLPKGPSE